MSYPHNHHEQPKSLASGTKSAFLGGLNALVHHVKRHVGVGIICSIAYFDPGNWSVDLQAGSDFGYRPMLFVILMAGLGAIVLQALACKLGCVTGLDLASHCRLLLHNHPRHPKLVRRMLLYPLYVLSEIAIISTDLAELLGSAIGFCLLFPKLPLWAGVVLTAADVLVFLSFTDPSRGQGRPVRMFEYTIIALVLAVFGCFIALLIKAQPDWSEVFMGYIPNKGLFQSEPDAVYAAVGILGATVMPHALFLGSSLATQDRVTDPLPETSLPTPTTNQSPSLRAKAKLAFIRLFRLSRAERVSSSIDYRSKYGERENNSYAFVKQHLSHGIADVTASLVALAVPINSAILILAATVFYNAGDRNHDSPAGLFEAHDLIKQRLGDGAALIFALALVCAGQTSSITVTLAGQIVSEGFIEWKMSPFLRRLITRCISLVPSVVVAIAVGRSGLNTLLVASQVVLSVVLPFVAFPLIYLTSAELVMQVRKPAPIEPTQSSDLPQPGEGDLPNADLEKLTDDKSEDKHRTEVKIVERIEELQVISRKDGMIDYSNGRVLTALAYAIWCVVLVANAYAIVMLFIKG
ncbi:natural resistance-associated macrophage protein-domain-containing protein [Panaeolus papilionaceus]|nr:natural resistance-associated macrophage protein-domain-containing protein [Panaeolus papilionaceus]